jgi:hypothetical protein
LADLKIGHYNGNSKNNWARIKPDGK